ncbi:glycoside hydrolase family 25 protein [Aquimarina sp. AU119]|uniref:glycoside hydrolase family 25 protein n=1 Tax=Aquimarina sp. AU119 TaxID=2108528 RepID=UPI000D686E3E|nr:GH25 family lysozyme [Aquimarina sp. AU119]
MKTLSIINSILILFFFSYTTTNKNTPCNSENERLEKDPSILGMDISHFQNDIDWDDIKEDGVNFVYIKASEGAHFKDPKFKKNHAAAINNCIYRGAYHFYETGTNPEQQAQNFIAAVDKLVSGDLPPVLDLEQGGIKTSVTKETYQKNTLKWLTIVEEKLGVIPIIYCDPSFGDAYLNHPDFAKYKLWVAEYTKKSPKVPETWKNKGWTFWQRTDSEKIEGIKGSVDYDIFQGKTDEFRKLLKK